MSLSPGTRLGPCEILSTVVAGGMGEVYKALDTRLDRTVAIKILPSEVSEAARHARHRDRQLARRGPGAPGEVIGRGLPAEQHRASACKVCMHCRQ